MASSRRAPHTPAALEFKDQLSEEDRMLDKLEGLWTRRNDKYLKTFEGFTVLLRTAKAFPAGFTVSLSNEISFPLLPASFIVLIKAYADQFFAQLAFELRDVSGEERVQRLAALDSDLGISHYLPDFLSRMDQIFAVEDRIVLGRQYLAPEYKRAGRSLLGRMSEGEWIPSWHEFEVLQGEEVVVETYDGETVSVFSPKKPSLAHGEPFRQSFSRQFFLDTFQIDSRNEEPALIQNEVEAAVSNAVIEGEKVS